VATPPPSGQPVGPNIGIGVGRTTWPCSWPEERNVQGDGRHHQLSTRTEHPWAAHHLPCAPPPEYGKATF